MGSMIFFCCKEHYTRFVSRDITNPAVCVRLTQHNVNLFFPLFQPLFGSEFHPVRIVLQFVHAEAASALIINILVELAFAPVALISRYNDV